MQQTDYHSDVCLAVITAKCCFFSQQKITMMFKIFINFFYCAKSKARKKTNHKNGKGLIYHLK